MYSRLYQSAPSLKHLVYALPQFDTLGVAFISLRDNLHLTTPTGRVPHPFRALCEKGGLLAPFGYALVSIREPKRLKEMFSRGSSPAQPYHSRRGPVV